jgi:Lrp/AsnC family transcriptional regulator, leucine-responsive regulatory protein
MTDLDNTDYRILHVLQRDGRIAIVDLAERAHLSPTACHKRVKRLEESGIIAGYSATVIPRALGYQIEAIVAVTIERQVKDSADAFKAAVAKLNGVRACYLLSGDTDFLLHIVAADLDACTKFVMNDIMTLPGAKAVRTSFVLDKVEATTPLNAPRIGH